MEQQNEETKILGIKRETVVLAIAIVGSVFAAVALLMPQFNSIEGNFNRMDGSIKKLNDALLQTNATIAELDKENVAQNAAQNEAIRALSEDVAANGKSIADMNTGSAMAKSAWTPLNGVFPTSLRWTIGWTILNKLR